jgi:hypothetical protein
MKSIDINRLKNIIINYMNQSDDMSAIAFNINMGGRVTTLTYQEIVDELTASSHRGNDILQVLLEYGLHEFIGNR